MNTDLIFTNTMMNFFDQMGNEFLSNVEEMKEEERRYIDFMIDLKKHDKIKIKFLIEKIGRTTEKKLLKEKVEKIKKQTLKEKIVYFENLPDDINNIISNYKKELEISTYEISINTSYLEFYGEYLLGENVTFGDMEEIAGCCGPDVSLEKLEEAMKIKSKYNINTDEGLREKKKELVTSAYILNRDR